jgi:F0F1-type ATP synthase membrane subunit c/vacuolar-type H+-ATPase subunit K
LLFVKAAKVIGLAFVFFPLLGCATATGTIFASLIRGVSYSPEKEDSMFAYTLLGFALVETYAMMI